MFNVLVSVIIPIYNTEKYIQRAVDSVLSQTYQNFEILLINDGSSDGSSGICENLSNQDKRIRYFYQKNQGVSVARNLGLKKAKGDYIFFLDSDDEWKNNLVEKVVECFQNSDCDMVRFGFHSHAPEVVQNDRIENAIYIQKELICKYFDDGIIYRNFSACWSGAYKKKLIDNGGLLFDKSLAIGEDGKFVLQYTLCCEQIQMIDEYLYEYYPIFENRANATSRDTKAIYDEYELCLLEYELIYKNWNGLLSETEKKQIYGSFIDRTIGRLVRLAAYTPMNKLSENFNSLKKFVANREVQEAIRFYVPKRATDSKITPWAIKTKNMPLLWCALKSRKGKYFKVYGRKREARSIWNGRPVVKC
jgi:glycosyltransferase involved in cell wall biosynthesis